MSGHDGAKQQPVRGRRSIGVVMRLAGAAAAAICLLVSFPARAADLDWCAPLAVRPDQHWWSTNPCEPWWKPETIAREADYVLGGFVVPSDATVTIGSHTCFGPKSMAGSLAYHEQLRALAAAEGRTLTALYLGRLDIMSYATVSSPGFDASYAVETDVPWTEVTDFFGLDNSLYCGCGCEWSDYHRANDLSDPPGERIRDFVDASAGSLAYQSKVYYGIRSNGGGTLEGAPRYFFGSAVMGDQGNPAYRAWRVAHMQDAIANGGFDGVTLNHKFDQWQNGADPHWWGGPKAPDVVALIEGKQTLWSAQPSNYTYLDYLEGWVEFAADLTAASVPFAVRLDARIWTEDLYDDSSTTTVNEAELIRDATELASWVLLDVRYLGTTAEGEAVAAAIEAQGIGEVVLIDTSCSGGPDEPVTPRAALSASLAVVPNAADIESFDGISITVKPTGVATGDWDADFWCNCASPPCGAPDASTTGETGSSWELAANLCSAVWRASAGVYRPRAEVARDSLIATRNDVVTMCEPACRDGVDNDADGAIDFPLDPGCRKETRNRENPECSDGVDNDGDGAIDHPADPDCAAPDRQHEAPACSDGLDNDGDGLFDWDGAGQGDPDPGCGGDPDDRSEQENFPRGRSCGVGGELALLATCLAWLMRRRTR